MKIRPAYTIRQAPPTRTVRGTRTYVGRMSRRLWAVNGGIAIGGIAGIAWMMQDLHSSAHLFRSIGAIFLAGVLWVALIVREGWLWRRVEQRAAARGGMLCPVCLYPLEPEAVAPSAELAPLICPECGERFTRGFLFQTWGPAAPPATPPAVEGQTERITFSRRNPTIGQ